MSPDMKINTKLYINTDDIYQEIGSTIENYEYTIYDHFIDAISYCVDDMLNTKKYIEKEEEINMNKVLELYAKRKKEEIKKKYEEIVEKDYKDLELVKQYNNIIEEFETKMDELYHNELNFGESTIYERYSMNDYKYALKDNVIDNLKELYKDDIDKEVKELNDLIEEVDAQLSLSNDLAYQQDILIKYNIIDKKTGKIKYENNNK